MGPAPQRTVTMVWTVAAQNADFSPDALFFTMKLFALTRATSARNQDCRNSISGRPHRTERYFGLRPRVADGVASPA